MSPEVALLNETWEIVRSTIPAKERLPVADALLRAFDESIGLSDIEEYTNEFDRVMKAAIKEYFDDGFDDEDDDHDGW